MSELEDLALLRRFEPVIRYTRGEYFFPMAVEPYVSECDLWSRSGEGGRRVLVPRGELTLDALAGRQAAPGSSMFLRFVQHPITGLERARHRWPRRDPFSAPGRLARVGIVARLIDAAFDLSLVVRGTVPGGTVAAAEEKYARVLAVDPSISYYGRVVRDAGWIVCHYLFFYAMNDWRSSFAGANDHEADWEQCLVFAQDAGDGAIEPIWFARAAHDEVGADLRRRWDDPILQREGDHPIIFAGAGSHAAYVEPGEYVHSIPLRLPRRVVALINGARNFWVDTLRQGTRRPGASKENAAAIPFVDYARGDGPSVGPGQTREWNPILVDDDTPWIAGYSGLFGLDTNDRFAGERAPAGPKFNRDGRPRQSWIDPLGFAGLHGVPPPSRQLEILQQELGQLEGDVADVARQVAEAEHRASALVGRVSASRRAGKSTSALAPVETARDTAIAEVVELRLQAEGMRAAIVDIQAELDRARTGDRGDPRAHLRFVARPQDPAVIARSRALEFWSAVGVAVAAVLLGALLIVGVDYWWVGLAGVALGYAVIEAAIRRRLLQFLLDLTVVLAVIGGAIFLITYPLEVLGIAVIAVGLLILRDNLREIRMGSRA